MDLLDYLEDEPLEYLLNLLGKPDPTYEVPFAVRVIEDCRNPTEYGPSGKLDGQYGVCLGLYEYPHPTTKAHDGNPLIVTPAGDRIWGIECWWAEADIGAALPLDLHKEAVDAHKRLIRSYLISPYDPTLN